MAWRIERDKNSNRALQSLCREQLVCKILADIAADISVCRLEGWDWRELPQRIKNEMGKILTQRGK